MNLERLPEIVEAVKPRERRLILRCRSGYYYQWERDDDAADHTEIEDFDAANACVVEMLRRLTKNGAWVTVQDDRITINSESLPEYDGVGFPGDPLNALYDAFTAHPEWFKEPTNG